MATPENVASPVGPLPLPAPAGATDADFSEPTTANLLAYLRFWLKWGLDDKLATMTAPPVTDTVPIANAYTNAPSSVYLQRKLPALFVYWTGKSTNADYSTVRRMRVRDFAILYAFERVVNATLVARWSGLVSTVDAIIARAFERLAHPAFAIDGQPLGRDIRFQFQWMGCEFMGGSEGFLKQLPQESLREMASAVGKAGQNRAQGGIQEGFPSFMGTVRVWEEIGRDQPLDPQDRNVDGTATLSGAEGSDDAVPLVTRILPEPDGSEQLGTQAGET